MRRYRKTTLRIALRNPNENWMAEKLKRTRYIFERQVVNRYRIYDFFCRENGVAVEVDGEDHEPDYDHWRDLDDWKYNRIIVLHVPNKSEADADRVIIEIAGIGDWAERIKSIPPETRPRLSIPSRRPAPKRRSVRRIRGHRA